MSKATTYHAGGFLPAAPAQNRATELDSVAGTFTSWNVAGTQTAQRAASAAELAALAAQDAALTGIETRAASRVLVRAIITDLQAEKDRMDPVIAKTNAQITGADTKDVARSARRIADAAIELARFVQDMP